MAPREKSRPVPQRTCIGCREEAGKRTLVRIVRTVDQHVIIDLTGRLAGRGAYIHSLPACWEKALKGATINHALKIVPAQEDVDSLRAFAQTLPAVESDTP
jgi:predicted RNA-binding protein YlxR (DUF448 family)